MARLVLLFVSCIASAKYFGASASLQQLPPPCSSEIYCQGELLHTIQMAQLYYDSKTFVDKKLRFKPEIVTANFTRLMNITSGSPSKDDLISFVNVHFESEGSEFEPWEPTDWVEEPIFLNKINSTQLQDWGLELHGAWKFLGRKIKDDVLENPDLYSMMYVPHPFIVPGGRFREFYYWDSYWIVQGLLLSEMTQTVKGMLENFLQIVDRVGLVPNGGRIYYERRSQPPMLIPMMDRYISVTKDVGFLRDSIHLLEKELLFWLNNRTVTVKGHTLARYNVETDGPRPESYREDIESAKSMNEKDRQEFYTNIKSGAESGWDFSSRWFIPDGNNGNGGNLTHIRTSQILPVDLNALICMNTRLLSNMYTLIGEPVKASLYHGKFIQWRRAIKEILWNDDIGIWFDYDLLNNVQRPFFYASNIAPLWADCWEPDVEGNMITKIIDYLEKSQSTVFAGGVPTSMEQSGQQWDFPNGWPPLQSMIVVGLENTGNPRAKAIAFQLAQRWLSNNYEAYQQSMPNAMFEKYDVTVVGLPGGGGEYDVQLGFGWTNGVIMEFLDMYGDRLVSVDELSEYNSLS